MMLPDTTQGTALSEVDAVANAVRDRPATQSERSEASRRVLIEAAINLLATEGYRALTFTRIQQAAGCSRGLVGYHFGTKVKLIQAVVAQIRGDYLTQTAQGRSSKQAGLAQALNIFDSYLTRLARNPKPATAMLVLATECNTSHPELREAVRDAYRQVREEFEVPLRAGIADGSVRASVDPIAHAGFLQGALRGITLQHFLDPDGFDLEATKQAAVTAFERDLAK